MQPQTRRTVLVSALAAAAMAATPALAGKDPIYTGLFSNAAASGYDVVAYFTQGKPVEGSKAHTVEWNGAEWRFASEEHRALFAANPEKYAPQYGGYCAYAVAKGSTASTVPDAWSIVDDKLYLNYSKGVQAKWDGDRAGFIAAANGNWPNVLN